MLDPTNLCNPALPRHPGCRSDQRDFDLRLRRSPISSLSNRRKTRKPGSPRSADSIGGLDSRIPRSFRHSFLQRPNRRAAGGQQKLPGCSDPSAKSAAYPKKITEDHSDVPAGTKSHDFPLSLFIAKVSNERPLHRLLEFGRTAGKSVDARP